MVNCIAFSNLGSKNKIRDLDDGTFLKDALDRVWVTFSLLNENDHFESGVVSLFDGRVIHESDIIDDDFEVLRPGDTFTVTVGEG